MMAVVHRKFNFSAGPATLPVAVLERCREELLDYRGSGMSVMEMSHRSAPFEEILAGAERALRELLQLPSDFRVLFLQGGASLQFSMVAMNLLKAGTSADYVVTGAWGKKALESARAVGVAREVFDGKPGGYRSVPHLETLELDPAAVYVHITTNETIQGVEFAEDPATGRPLIADMSSDILSRPVAVDRYALIYAGAQKNMGPAGLTVVLLTQQLLESASCDLSPMLDYQVHAKNGSLYNTPPAWSIYVTGLVYEHLIASGGLQAASLLREERAAIVYDAIDRSEGFYRGHAEPNSRSKMNVTFTLQDDALTRQFLEEAERRNMDGLPGHRSVGGCRASLYNAFPIEGCHRLAELMDEFAARKRR